MCSYPLLKAAPELHYILDTLASCTVAGVLVRTLEAKETADPRDVEPLSSTVNVMGWRGWRVVGNLHFLIRPSARVPPSYPRLTTAISSHESPRSSTARSSSEIVAEPVGEALPATDTTQVPYEDDDRNSAFGTEASKPLWLLWARVFAGALTARNYASRLTEALIAVFFTILFAVPGDHGSGQDLRKAHHWYRYSIECLHRLPFKTLRQPWPDELTGYTPLSYASKRGHGAAVRRLLLENVNVHWKCNAFGPKPSSTLYTARINGQEAMTMLFDGSTTGCVGSDFFWALN